MASTAGSAPLSAADPCCPVRVGVIVGKDLKEGELALADSEKVHMDPCW